ncbi:MAG TPA: right-handed parallel beta-helix repeat-containing protein [Thermoanaerobaculia bacterium]|nr:right-handed parallel beta-helix repeat-containing protein [Thermoanaerobaculia bacterium]
MKLRLFIGLAVTTLLSTSLFGQATRTWVSGVGDDLNPCSRTAPCKTFAGAISKTAIAGEINVLDSGGFGSVTITKSITIDGAGSDASVLASGTNGITINIAVNANDPLRRVILRNLSINGTGLSGTIGTNTGLTGINITSSGATSVIVENVVIQNFNKGISATPTSSTNLFLSNVDILTCSTNGIALVPTSPASIIAVMDNVRVARTGTTSAHDGILITNSVSAQLNFVTVAGSFGSGLHLNGTSTATIDHSTFARNVVHGVNVDNAVAVVRVGNSAAVQNSGAGFHVTSGAISSYRNNLSSDNGLADSGNTQQAFF